MKNSIEYYYGLISTTIHQINNNYRFFVGNEEYLLIMYSDTKELLLKKYELCNYLLQNKIPVHQIIPNTNNEIATFINGNQYVLLKKYIENRKITIDDVALFSNFYVDSKYYNDLVKSNWYNLWIKKIDYFEYQLSQFGKKFPIIRESINYYIGLAENSISLLLKVNINNYLVISHNRIKNNSNLNDLYNPLNFILDNRTRNLGEYIKDKFFFSKYTIDDAKNDILKFKLDYDSSIILFIRLLFPSYYFDCYEEIVFGEKEETVLNKVIQKNGEYIKFIKEIGLFLNLNSILSEMDWIIKT